ncbi:MAG TPA: GGDEF domain-containing phosphodiesterase [Stenomitos sp.]
MVLDSFVRNFAQRLKSCVKFETLIGRVSPSEFAIALFKIPTFESVIDVAQLILSTQAKLFQIGETSIRATASIGITMGDISEIDHTDKLLQQAQIALEDVKRQGQQPFRFYSPDINAQLQERLALEHDLHGALERGEFSLHYQPLVDLQSGRVEALEALLRWQHPKRGMISPDKFIPIAEANGEIVAIGEWVLQTACVQARHWQNSGCKTFRISINLSARQFEQDDLAVIVNEVLQETGLAPMLLELEVTESFLMNNVRRSAETLKQLKALGVVIALDDFGTGYSSLNYLNRFPIDMLKIDRSFVRDLTPHSDAAAIIDAVIALAKSLNLSITAEGVETVEQLCYLQEKGCDEGQGFFFSRPLAPEAVLPVLKSSFQKQLSSCNLSNPCTLIEAA